jgi:hypothetical protein
MSGTIWSINNANIPQTYNFVDGKTPSLNLGAIPNFPGLNLPSGYQPVIAPIPKTAAPQNVKNMLARFPSIYNVKK